MHCPQSASIVVAGRAQGMVRLGSRFIGSCRAVAFCFIRARSAPAVPCAHSRKVFFGAHNGCAHGRKSYSGRTMRAPAVANFVPGAQCVLPRSQVLSRAHDECPHGREPLFVSSSVARSDCGARKERALASRSLVAMVDPPTPQGGWGSQQGESSGRSRARPGSRDSGGTQWA